MLGFKRKIWSVPSGKEKSNSKSWTFERKRSLTITMENMAARDQVEYLLLRWTRNEPPQLPVKRILYIAGWIEPNGWVIGSAHYLSFVINVCCCNKRLGPSVMRGTNGFELLYNGRQNTQNHRTHNKAISVQTNSIALVNQGFFIHYEVNGRVKGGLHLHELHMCCEHHHMLRGKETDIIWSIK